MLCQLNSIVSGLAQIRGHQVHFPQDPDASTVSVEKFAVLRELLELNLCQLHETFDFILGPVEVLGTESVDGDYFDASLVAHFQNLVDAKLARFLS